MTLVMDMRTRLKNKGLHLYVFHQEALSVFEKIAEKYTITNVYSHQEIGNKITYDRDIAVAAFFKKHSIGWNEYQHNGVIRKLKSRKIWESRWKQKMEEHPKLIDEETLDVLELDSEFYRNLKGPALDSAITENNKSFQPGGESNAWK